KLISEIGAWNVERNEKEVKTIWRFTNEKARIKLKKLYPVF
ncbi:MAG: IS630 family transposase, partial [Candidatus Anammoxibacter sp.]